MFLPLLILMSSFVIDVGNWFAHKRHLQMQADAAALAAAQDLRSPCADGTINDTVASYSGRDYNAQIQNKQSNVHVVVNSKTYYNQATPVDNTVDTNPPCTAEMVDVKLTETDLPWYFKVANVPFINAHARVGLFTVDRYTGSLPLAVPDVDPKKVVAQFFDEGTGSTIANVPLTRGAAAGGLSRWDNSGAPAAVKVDKANIGVRLILSGSNSTTCGDPLVACYGTSQGLDYVRGWTADGSATQPNQPLARSVTLEPGTCGDAYFNVLAAGTSCQATVRATLDFGGVAPANVKVSISGSKPADQLTYDAGTGTWVSQPKLPVTAGTANWVDLDWEVTSGTIGGSACNTTNKNPCKGTFTHVQRSFAGNDALSGPVQAVDVSENNVPDMNSFERCSAIQTSCTHNLVVSVGLLPDFQVAKSVNDPLVKLRFSGGGSQSQGLDCDDNSPTWGNPNAPGALPNFSLFDVELQWGCRPTYTQNTGTPCPANASALWGTAAPWQCVATQTGQYVNKIGKGLNARILCPKPDWGLAACATDPSRPTACTHPNNWSQFTTGLPANDTRIVQLFVTQYGAFSGSGSSTVPVLRFATFYVTGWNGSGGGFPNPCQGNGDDTAADGEIVGHFIKYIDVLGSSTGTSLCDFSDSSPCVPVLVR